MSRVRTGVVGKEAKGAFSKKCGAVWSALCRPGKVLWKRRPICTRTFSNAGDCYKYFSSPACLYKLHSTCHLRLWLALFLCRFEGGRGSCEMWGRSVLGESSGN